MNFRWTTKRSFIVIALAIGGLFLIAWADGLVRAIRQGDVASFRDYVRLQIYSLKVRNLTASSTATLKIEPTRVQYLREMLREYALQRGMVAASNSMTETQSSRRFQMDIWGGNAFLIAIRNSDQQDMFTVSFAGFDSAEDWRPYRDDFVEFLQVTFGSENVTVVDS